MHDSNSDIFQMRPMIHGDLMRVLAWRNHPDVRRYMYTQHEINPTEHQLWFESSLLDKKKHLLIFEINQNPVGFVNLNENGGNGMASWGFYLAPDAPQGSGLQLGRAALNHAFIQLNLKKLNGEALSYNHRSIQFHKRLGFREEGTLRDKHFDGEHYHHVICFGLLCQEWKLTTKADERKHV